MHITITDSGTRLATDDAGAATAHVAQALHARGSFEVALTDLTVKVETAGGSVTFVVEGRRDQGQTDALVSAVRALLGGCERVLPGPAGPAAGPMRALAGGPGLWPPLGGTPPRGVWGGLGDPRPAAGGAGMEGLLERVRVSAEGKLRTACAAYVHGPRGENEAADWRTVYKAQYGAAGFVNLFSGGDPGLLRYDTSLRAGGVPAELDLICEAVYAVIREDTLRAGQLCDEVDMRPQESHTGQGLGPETKGLVEGLRRLLAQPSPLGSPGAPSRQGVGL